MYLTDVRTSPTSLSIVDSYRTGKRAAGRYVGENPPVYRPGDDIGVYERRRLDYFKRLGQNMADAKPYSGNILTQDSGHTFKLLSSFQSGHILRWWAGIPPTTYYGGLLLGSPSVRASDFVSTIPLIKYASHAQRFSDLLDVGASLTQRDVTSAYNNMYPDQRVGGWGETIVELARGNFPRAVPLLLRRISSVKDGLRKAGSDYLNAQFGIAPIVSDLVKLVEHLLRIQSSMYDSVKRERSTITRVNTGEVRQFIGNFNGTIGGTNLSARGRPQWYVQSDVRIVAKFAKNRPTLAANGYADRAQEFLRMAGVDARLAWDLVPWSWLVDWIVNIGDQVTAAQNMYQGRHIATYAWCTERNTLSATCGKLPISDRWGLFEQVQYAVSRVEYMERYPLNPFGGLGTASSLNPSQWAILSALGFSRLR